MTAYGLSFGAADSTATAFLGQTLAGTSSWTTDTSMAFYYSQPTGPLTTGSRTAKLTIAALVGTSARALFSFDAPAVTAHQPYNVAVCATVSLSLRGMNFGTYDATATISTCLPASSWGTLYSFASNQT